MGSVTRDEILDALREALNAPEYGDGMTGPEIAKVLGVGCTWARRLIRECLDRGELELVTLRRVRMDGMNASIVGYRRRAK